MSQGKPNYNNQNQNRKPIQNKGKPYYQQNQRRERNWRDDVILPVKYAGIDEIGKWAVRNTRKLINTVLDGGVKKIQEIVKDSQGGKIKALDYKEPTKKPDKSKEGKGNR